MLDLAEQDFLAPSQQPDFGWADRSAHWLASDQAAQPTRNVRSRNAKPIILCGHGVSLRVQSGCLIVRDGFTHHPQKRHAHRYFPGDLSLPPRIILLDGSGSVSFDALTWLSEQGVVLIRIDWTGKVASVLSSHSYAADRSKVQWQIETRADKRRRMAFSIDLIRQKITNSIITLETVLPSSTLTQRSCASLHSELAGLTINPPLEVDLLRGIEGPAGAAYFAAWQALPLQWKTTARHPIPDAWRAVGPRSAIRAGKSKNKNASHPLNAMLNYAYAVLHSQLQIELVSAGYDPTIGIMHHGFKGSPALVFDMMEPSRPIIDAAILRFALSTTFSGNDFILRNDGVVRLNPQLARRVSSIAADIRPVGTELSLGQ